MERNEIIKALYKEKPKAILIWIRIGVAYYEAALLNGEMIRFEVPVSDMGTADWYPEMEAKHLVRWITKTY